MLYCVSILYQGFERYLQIGYKRISRHRLVYHVFVCKIIYFHNKEKDPNFRKANGHLK